MKVVHIVTFLLLVIGGLNWLLVGLIGWDVGMLFGGQSALISRIIYILVGLSAVVEIATHKKNCKVCNEKKAMPADTSETVPPISNA
ncbi:MAG: DUF378 domain-containing protein [Candidatus Buchananbacteria bacterium]|nr:DUF378 domain-containing protein [Candidatus Buchananbacteria bacterium]